MRGSGHTYEVWGLRYTVERAEGAKMSFLEFLGVALSSTGLFASVLGAFLTYAARQNGQATRALI